MVSRQEIQKVAESARLILTEEEADRFTKDSNEILAAFGKIKEVDTENVEPSFQPIMVHDIMREDMANASLSQEQALSQTEHKKDGYFKGPRII